MDSSIAEVNEIEYPTLQKAIDAASRRATVKLLADTKENVTISTPDVTLDLNGHTLNGGTEMGKPALTVTALRVAVVDSSKTQAGTIKREDTAENSDNSSHYVIDIQGKGLLYFNGGNVTNNSGTADGKGAPLVRVGGDSKTGVPGLTINGGTFTQNNFTVIKVNRGSLNLNDGTLNSANSYAIEDWHWATIKGGTVNGKVAAWTYSGGYNSELTIKGGTVNGDVKSVTYDGAEGKTAKVSITGGVVNGTLSASKYNSTEPNDPAKATIEVSGGTFSADPSQYVAGNFAATQNADGKYDVAQAQPIAQVGEANYYTMDEALKAQTTSGEAITLLRDYTTGSPFKSGTVNRVVDLNGHTWTCTGTDANSAAFEINNPNASLTVKNGKVVSSQLVGLIPSAMGGTIKYDNSTLTFEGVEASTTATSGIETNGNNTNDTVVLKDSTLNVRNGFGIYFPSSGTLTIDNSTINAKTMGVQVCSGSLNVNAGSKIAVSGGPVKKLEGDGAIQDGAAISIVNRHYKGLDKVAITGGTFTAKAGNAALKAYTWDSSTKHESAFDNSAKIVAVSGGTFSSAVSSDLCVKGSTPVKNDDGTYSVGAPVAQIGMKKYATLAEAVAAAEDGQTVTLLTDVEQNSQLPIDKSITLDLNGKTIKNTQDIWGENSNAILSVKNGAKVTITGDGTIDAKENDCYTINVVKGDLTIENGTFYGNISVVQVQEGTLSVKGGTFDLHQKWEGGSKYLINCIDKAYVGGSASVAISGGTFVGFDPNVSPEQKVDGKVPSFAAPGAGIIKNEDGSFTAATGMAAQILDKDGNSVKAYTSLQDAVAAANASTEDATISLRENITVDNPLVIDNANGRTITLDLQKFTLKSTYAMGSASGEGRYALVNKTPLTVTNGTFAAGEARAIGAYGALTLNGANVTQKLTGSDACVAFCANGKNYTIKNSTVDGAYAVCNFANNSTVNIAGSKLVGTGNTLYHNGSNYGLKLTVKDTTITSSGSCGVYISGSTSAQSNADNQNGAGGYQKAIFTGCTISGALNGVEVKYTDLTLDSCTASTTTEDASYKQDNNGPAGSGFAVVSTDNAVNNVTPKPKGTIIVKGEGKYTGPVGLGSLKSVKETYADFADETIKVSGGTFTTAVPEMYCAAGYAPSDNADGTYGVKLAEGAYLLQDYRSGDQASWKYPTPQDGMAFAGWYKDAAFKTPCTESDVEGAAYAKFVKISDLITFKGGSLRTDLTGKDDYSKTSLRFGYEMHAPEGSKIDFQNWGWYYKSPSSAEPKFVNAKNYWRIDGNGVIANLVLSPIYKSGYKLGYSTVFDVTAQLAYITADGTGVKVKDQSRSRSVDQVAKAIQNDSFASADDLAYANGILESN